MAQVRGPRQWRVQQDKDGYRTYSMSTLVELADGEGPAAALDCPGLPAPGSAWQLRLDSDLWAFCTPECSASQHPSPDGGPVQYALVEQTFSTKPPDSGRCADDRITDPLLTPPVVDGYPVRYQEEATLDRFGNAIRTSSHERFRGPQVEFDASRSSVRIVQNVATIDQAAVLPGQMADTLNMYPLWGWPPRCVKLDPPKWTTKYHGQCYKYYTRTLEFNVNVRRNPLTAAVESGFDRDLLDEGTKALGGPNTRFDSAGVYIPGLVNGQQPDPQNAMHFVRFKDAQGNLCSVILDGSGMPAGIPIAAGTPQTIIADTAITDNVLLVPSIQPSPAAKLLITFSEPTVISATFTATLVGTDENNISVTEVYTYATGNRTWVTQNFYGNVASLRISDISSAFSIPLPAGGPRVIAKTSTRKSSAGNVHVEFYNESDFSLLNIPLIL